MTTDDTYPCPHHGGVLKDIDGYWHCASCGNTGFEVGVWEVKKAQAEDF